MLMLAMFGFGTFIGKCTAPATQTPITKQLKKDGAADKQSNKVNSEGAANRCGKLHMRYKTNDPDIGKKRSHKLKAG